MLGSGCGDLEKWMDLCLGSKNDWIWRVGEGSVKDDLWFLICIVG